jgi:photosystem II stability/assembly factor-like uncharacterized protein
MMKSNAQGGLWIAIAWLVAVSASAGENSRAHRWEPVGLTGGGGMFAPAISPVDPRVMMLNCDMSGAYITRDGGQNWSMIHQNQLRSSTRCRPAFHPTDGRVIFAAEAGAGMKVSRDGGEHWTPVRGAPANLMGEIAIDPGHPVRMMAGDASAVGLSNDGGATWRPCRGPHGRTLAFHFDQTSDPARRVCFAATSEGIWRSEDGGVSWSEATRGLPWKEIRSFCGGSRARDGKVVLYCAIQGRAEESAYTGGVFRSTDRGASWQSAMGRGINKDIKAADPWSHGPVAQYDWVLTTDVQPEIVYALNENTGVLPPHHTAVYRSDDAGANWRPTFFPDPRFQQCNVQPDFITVADGQYYQSPPFGAAIAAGDPDRIVQVATDVYITTNGGKTWECGSARRAPGTGSGAGWDNNGLVITTTWNYYIDPFEPKRHYIAYTDIGLARSLDAGKTWLWWDRKGRAPWRNTCYEMAFDPSAAGTIWGAFSDVHDIPNGNIIHNNHSDNHPGGVCVSHDHGATWTACSDGLPKAAVVSVVLDPRSPVGRRTLYASVFNHGVYKSIDGGSTWRPATTGLGSKEDRRVCRIQLQRDGTLFALVTAHKIAGNQFVKDGPGLYRSTDGGAHWELVNASRPLYWPKDFLVDPSDSRVIYIGAADGRADQAGLWRTRDAGTTWERLAHKGPEHFGAYLHPARKGWIYMTLTEGAPGSGLWLSKDDGRTWTAMSLPFANAQRVAFDPADPDTILVTTFGGSVWKGPASED